MTSHVVSGGLSGGGRPHDSIDCDSCRRRNAAAMRRGSDAHTMTSCVRLPRRVMPSKKILPVLAMSCSGLDVDAKTKFAFM